MTIEIDVVLDYDLPAPHDVLLQIEVAQLASQRILSDRLTVASPERLTPIDGNESIGQRTWAAARGRFLANYQARVDIDRPPVALDGLASCDPKRLPPLVVPYLLPSRYCASDSFEPFVQRSFDGIEGGAKVLAMRDWIAGHVAYMPGTSTASTTAADTFVQRQGVCRDFAHLLVTFARAAMIPARMVSAYAPGVTPPDFHALAEVWLEDGWHLVDATGMADPQETVIIGVGRDATDIAFMTVFGVAELREQRVTVSRA